MAQIKRSSLPTIFRFVYCWSQGWREASGSHGARRDGRQALCSVFCSYQQDTKPSIVERLAATRDEMRSDYAQSTEASCRREQLWRSRDMAKNCTLATVGPWPTSTGSLPCIQSRPLSSWPRRCLTSQQSIAGRIAVRQVSSPMLNSQILAVAVGINDGISPSPKVGSTGSLSRSITFPMNVGRIAATRPHSNTGFSERRHLRIGHVFLQHVCHHRP